MSTNTASIVAAIGASGSGKSFWVKQQLKTRRPPRLLIWDPQGEYASFGTVYTDRVKLVNAIGRARTFTAIYQPGDRQSQYADRFDWFCRVAYAVGDLVLIVEELADVTTPSRAPDGWSVVTRKGRHKALRVVAVSQRPASVDKDFFGNCTMIHCGRLNYERDLTTMAGVLNVKPADIAALKADKDTRAFEWIERDMATGATRRGKLKGAT